MIEHVFHDEPLPGSIAIVINTFRLGQVLILDFGFWILDLRYSAGFIRGMDRANLLRQIGNAEKERYRRSKIRNLKSKIYNDEDTKHCETIFWQSF